MASKLISAKELVLPSTTLTDGCYQEMFYMCSSLTTVPNKLLPCTSIIANDSYAQMFYGCSRLTSAPELPSTTLGGNCYYYMFSYCTSLTTAPELPALYLVSNSYQGMFSGCTSLNYVKALFITTPGSSYTSNWLNKVSDTGTFVKNSAAAWTDRGKDAIPSNWTVETVSV